MGGSKLGAHISVQPGLLSEVVPFHLLLMEELGFLLAMSNEGLKRRPVSKIQKYMKKEESKREDQVDTWPVGTMTSRRMLQDLVLKRHRWSHYKPASLRPVFISN